MMKSIFVLGGRKWFQFIDWNLKGRWEQVKQIIRVLENLVVYKVENFVSRVQGFRILNFISVEFKGSLNHFIEKPCNLPLLLLFRFKTF